MGDQYNSDFKNPTAPQAQQDQQSPPAYASATVAPMYPTNSPSPNPYGNAPPYPTNQQSQQQHPQANYGAPPPPAPAVYPPYPGQGYPPPGYGVNGQQPPVVVVQQAPRLGHEPCNMKCPHCHASIQTTVDYEVSMGTWLMCLIIFGVGFLVTLVFLIGFVAWFLCCVPCCMRDCKAAEHTCPKCHAFIYRANPKYLS
ncbi:lipopolysaccharide-induced tumor necrosis factor-alpha factor homolog [Symsagittifera roscoffensis]|uniref:lipopolysaccharide-induced tumor necrosis factor-alpha factor homolog n=1 Tax=Symsagittifera roscoffensis TaxID=84072 RepID=UPI00307C89B9